MELALNQVSAQIYLLFAIKDSQISEASHKKMQLF